MKFENPSIVVRKAREKLLLNQKEFAKHIGKTQSVLSRYESERVEPPAQVLMQCVNILLSDPTPNSTDSVDEIITKIKTLDGEQFSRVRKALNILLEEIAN